MLLVPSGPQTDHFIFSDEKLQLFPCERIESLGALAHVVQVDGVTTVVCERAAYDAHIVHLVPTILMDVLARGETIAGLLRGRVGNVVIEAVHATMTRGCGGVRGQPSATRAVDIARLAILMTQVETARHWRCGICGLRLHFLRSSRSSLDWTRS